MTHVAHIYINTDITNRGHLWCDGNFQIGSAIYHLPCKLTDLLQNGITSDDVLIPPGSNATATLALPDGHKCKLLLHNDTDTELSSSDVNVVSIECDPDAATFTYSDSYGRPAIKDWDVCSYYSTYHNYLLNVNEECIQLVYKPTVKQIFECSIQHTDYLYDWTYGNVLVGKYRLHFPISIADLYEKGFKCKELSKSWKPGKRKICTFIKGYVSFRGLAINESTDDADPKDAVVYTLEHSDQISCEGFRIGDSFLPLFGLPYKRVESDDGYIDSWYRTVDYTYFLHTRVKDNIIRDIKMSYMLGDI